ncbi:unnamed protein product [Clonostachys solani]|uniref:Uncharacterized protein n=1 Tax=Clonostachys solani TaxID=160281 RepID=A0A9N9ZJB0_9HYPO|nr:unnamed protein product [Clonostachys solani]
MNNSSTTFGTDPLVGFVADDTTRGTLSIISSCMFTIIICTWTTIHPRIHVSRRLRNTHKFYQLVKALFAPEMVCLESLQEFLQARKAVRRCYEATGGRFKVIHGFYLGMMGVRYRVGDNGGYRTLWPGQYAWLLNHGLVSWDDHEAWGLSQPDIEDKNKADGLVKLATLLQVIWFTLQSITRLAHSLPLAAIETMALAYVFNAVITYGFWWMKPKDIATASFVDLPEMTDLQREVFEGLSMENTYDVSGEDQEPAMDTAWYVVARDCQDDDILLMPRANDSEHVRPTVSRLDKGSILEAQLDSDASSNTEKKAADGVITEWDANLYMTRYWPLLCLLGASFGAVHLISWSSVFPTTVELWLWRSSALLSVVTAVLFGKDLSPSLK